jgi:general secretion pathway protein G
MRRFRTGNGRRGYTLLEAVIATAVLLVLASVAIPSAKHFVKRQKEIELRRALREIRSALETYHRCAQLGLISPLDADPNQPWPKTLQELEEGVQGGGAWGGPRMKVRFLRRLPKDPFNVTDDGFDDDTGWRLRSPQDSPDSNMWGRDRIFEVYSGSEARALDGSYYKDW